MDQNNFNNYNSTPQQSDSAPAQPAEDTENTAAQASDSAQQTDRTQQNPNGQTNPYAQPNSGTQQNAYGQAPYNQNPYGQNPYGQNPYAQPGQSPYGQPPYGQNPYGQRNYQPYGTPYNQNQNPYGQGYNQPPYGQPQYRAPYNQPYTPPYSQAPIQPYPQDPQFAQKQAMRSKIKVLSRTDGLAVLGFSLFAFFLSMILFSIPGFQTAYEGNQLFSGAIDVVYSLFVIFVPFLLAFLFLKKRGEIKDLPLGTPYDGKAAVLLVFAGLACCIAGSYVTSILSSLVENLFGITFTMPESDTVIDSVPMFLLTVLGTAVVPACVEEFAIRGVVMQPLRKYGDKFAILMSAVVFALMHGNMVQIPFAFIAGLAIGYAVVVTGSMWTGVLIHFLNNFASVVMQTAIDNLSDNGSTVVILCMVAVILAVGVLCAVIYGKRYARVPMASGDTLLQNAEKNKAYVCTVPMILAILLLVFETAQYVEF